MNDHARALRLYELDESMPMTDDGEGRWRSVAGRAYGNRVGPYGGWIAALLMRAILEQRPQGEPLSITITYLGGCKDGPLTGTTRLLRRSRTNEHWTAEFSDSEAPVAHTVASFGLRRPTIPLGDMPPPAPAPEPETAPPQPSFPGSPGFLERFERRVFEGNPFEGERAGHTRSRAWVRDMDRRPLDYVSLTSHADSPMPRIFLKSGTPGATATMSMTVYFHATQDAFAEVGGDFVLVEAECRHGHDGFHDQTARIWARSGKLLATTEQVVWYNAKPAGEA
jgi:acyl-CoA thioesterase